MGMASSPARSRAYGLARVVRTWVASLVLAALAGMVIDVQPAVAATLVSTGRVFGVSSLNVRSGPSTTFPVVRRVGNGTPLVVVCHTLGLRVAGSARVSALWDRLSDGRYVSDAYVAWSGRPVVAWCAMGAVARGTPTLNLRRSTTTAWAPVGAVGFNTRLAVLCQLGGEFVAGSIRQTALWDRLTNGRFVSDAYVAWPGARPAVPWCILSSGAPPPGTAFITWASGYSRMTMQLYRVPASVTLAQSILESGWGRSALTLDANSYFGMKCFGTPGIIATGCRPYRTTECASSGCFETSAAFRVYSSIWASFRDHAYALATLPRYRTAFLYTNNPDRFVIEIHRAGYATSPTYAQHLIALMRQYNLYRFDRALPRA
jgi:mannosyl-glycoprotein endo-beta-N-acetylglucosaminidase